MVGMNGSSFGYIDTYLLCSGCSSSSMLPTMKRTYEQQTTMKVWMKTHDKLRLLAALRRKSMIEWLDHLFDQDVSKARKEDVSHEQEEKRREYDNLTDSASSNT